MTLPTEGRAGLTTWTEPRTRVPYSVILADDFGVTVRALASWDSYKEQLGTVKTVLVSFAGIEGLPIGENDLAGFLALGSTGAGLALSGTNCGYGGEGPHGTARILRELGVTEAVVGMVFSQRRLRFERLEDRWMVEVGSDESG